MTSHRASGPGAVYVPEIDEEHRNLFVKAAALRRAFGKDASGPETRARLCELVSCASEHFAHEERMMRATRYASSAWHKRQHSAARTRIGKLEESLRRGDANALPEFLRFLSGWLVNHVSVADRMMAAHLRNAKRSAAADS